MGVNMNNLKIALKTRLSQKPFTLSLIAFMVGISVFAYGVTKAATPKDCDSNAIIRCGVYDSGAMIDQYNHNTNGVKDIYNHFQIDGDFSGMVDGTVTKDNKVIVGGQVVATNAITSGRGNISPSQAISLGGRTFYKRPPSVSFNSSSIPAYVKMVNGQFKWAVIKSCGNPVQGSPTFTPAPATTIQKKVTTDLTSPTDVAYFSAPKTVQAEKGQQVRFIMQASNTGNTQVAGYVLDRLPAGTSFVSGKYIAKHAGVVSASGNISVQSPDGRYGWIGILQPGDEVKLDIIVSYNVDSPVTNIVCIKTNELPNEQCDNSEITPVISNYICTNLTVEKLTTNSFKFSATGAVTGSAVITGYIFKVNDKEVYNGEANNYTYNQVAPGTYNVKAFIKTNKGNTTEVAVCNKEFTIKPVLNPSYTIKKYVEDRDAQDNASSVAIQPNVPFTYKVEVKNTGDVDLNNVKVWDILPLGVTYVDNTLKQDGAALTADSNFFDVAKGVILTKLNKSQTITFTFQAVIKASTDEEKIKLCNDKDKEVFYNNIAKADPESAEGVEAGNPNLGEKQDPAVIKCKFTPPVKHPSIDIEKEVSKYNLLVGEQFTWYITVTNNGDTDLTNVKVSDSAPSHIEFISSPNIDGATIKVTTQQFDAVIASLKVGQKITFSLSAKLIAYNDGKEITNTACVNAPEVNPNDPNKTDDCDDAKVKPTKEKCDIPGMENKNKDDPTCKEMCSVKGKQNLYKDDKNCKDDSCVEVNGKVTLTNGKGECIKEPVTNSSNINGIGDTPSTGLNGLASLGLTLSLGAIAFMGTVHVRNKSQGKRNN